MSESKTDRREFIKASAASASALASVATLSSQTALADRTDDEPSRPATGDPPSQLVLLDTESLLWADQGDPRLGVDAKRLLDQALARNELCVSSVSFWEILCLKQANRIAMKSGVSQWRRELLDAGIREIGVDGIIGVPADDDLDGVYFRGAKLSIELRPQLDSPRDRLTAEAPHLLASLVVATAIRLNATFVTSDRGLLSWKSDEFELRRHDARV